MAGLHPYSPLTVVPGAGQLFVADVVAELVEVTDVEVEDDEVGDAVKT